MTYHIGRCTMCHDHLADALEAEEAADPLEASDDEEERERLAYVPPT